jgi:transcriptional regulator of acetoin/glycerol metabolism
LIVVAHIDAAVVVTEPHPGRYAGVERTKLLPGRLPDGLEETNGKVTRTAELLGLERSNLYRKMKAPGIGPKE